MNKRTELLQIALKLFSDYGYESIGIQKIVEDACVKKPTLYYYFKSKKGLIEEIVETNFSVLMHELVSKASYNGHLLTSLEQMVKTFFIFAQQNQDFYRLFLTMYSCSKQSEQYSVIEPHINRLKTFVSKVFVDAVNEHGNIRDKQDQLTITLIGIVNAYIQLFLHDDFSFDDTTYFMVTKQFMHGIFS